MKLSKEKNNVFKRLKSSETEKLNKNNQGQSIINTTNIEEIKMTEDNCVNPKNNLPSIFSRLGSKDDKDIPIAGTKEIKPILKKTAKNVCIFIISVKFNYLRLECINI